MDTRASTHSDPGAAMFTARPYAVTGGRTEPSAPLDMMSLVCATGRARMSVEHLNQEHHQALKLCGTPVTVAEVSAQLQMTVTVTKIILSDLIELGVIIARYVPVSSDFSNDPSVLQAVIDGLRKFT